MLYLSGSFHHRLQYSLIFIYIIQYRALVYMYMYTSVAKVPYVGSTVHIATAIRVTIQCSVLILRSHAFARTTRARFTAWLTRRSRGPRRSSTCAGLWRTRADQSVTVETHACRASTSATICPPPKRTIDLAAFGVESRRLCLFEHALHLGQHASDLRVRGRGEAERVASPHTAGEEAMSRRSFGSDASSNKHPAPQCRVHLASWVART